MKITRIIATSLLGAAFSGPASAAAGEGSALGKCIRAQRSQDAAIDYCTQVLEGGNLKPADRALSHLSRGLALGHRGTGLPAASASAAKRLFYVAERKSLQQNPSEAARFFGSAIEVCPKDFLEYELAAAELSHLGASPRDLDQPRRK